MRGPLRMQTVLKIGLAVGVFTSVWLFGLIPDVRDGDRSSHVDVRPPEKPETQETDNEEARIKRSHNTVADDLNESKDNQRHDEITVTQTLEQTRADGDREQHIENMPAKEETEKEDQHQSMRIEKQDNDDQRLESHADGGMEEEKTDDETENNHENTETNKDTDTNNKGQHQELLQTVEQKDIVKKENEIFDTKIHQEVIGDNVDENKEVNSIEQVDKQKEPEKIEKANVKKEPELTGTEAIEKSDKENKKDKSVKTSIVQDDGKNSRVEKKASKEADDGETAIQKDNPNERSKADEKEPSKEADGISKLEKQEIEKEAVIQKAKPEIHISQKEREEQLRKEADKITQQQEQKEIGKEAMTQKAKLEKEQHPRKEKEEKGKDEAARLSEQQREAKQETIIQEAKLEKEQHLQKDGEEQAKKEADRIAKQQKQKEIEKEAIKKEVDRLAKQQKQKEIEKEDVIQKKKLENKQRLQRERDEQAKKAADRIAEQQKQREREREAIVQKTKLENEKRLQKIKEEQAKIQEEHRQEQLRRIANVKNVNQEKKADDARRAEEYGKAWDVIEEYSQKQAKPSTRVHSGYIHIAAVACGDRMPETVTLLKSARMLSRARLHFHVFTEDELKANFSQAFDAWPEDVKKKTKFSIRSLAFPPENAAEWKKLFKPCASQRLFLPDLLTKQDAVLYLDTDILFMRPPEDIWQFFTRFNESHIAALAPEHEDANIGWYNRFARHPYYEPLGVNSGVMLMNLTRMRKEGWVTAMIPYLKEYKYRITWGDQDLINIYFHYKPEMLYIYPCHWNFRPDHCMYMSICTQANDHGANLVHGNRRVWFNEKQPAFKALYRAFEEHKFEDGLNALLKRLDDNMAATDVKHTNCGKNSEVMTKQLKRQIGLIPKRKANTTKNTKDQGQR